MKNGKKAISLALSLSLVIGCLSGGSLLDAKKKNPKKDKTVQKLTVTNVPGKKLIMQKGKTFKIKTKLKLKKGSKASKKLVYKSNKKAIVSVNQKGVIKARKLGKAKITVSSKANPSKKVVLTITVSNKVARVKKLSLNKKKLTLYIGSVSEEESDEEDTDEEDWDEEEEDEEYYDEDDTDEEMDEVEDDGSLDEDEYELIAKISPKTAAAAKLVWTSSNPDIVEVDDDGYVLAMEAGTATITVTAKDGSNKKATCKVTVIDLGGDEDDSEDYDDSDDEEDSE